METAADAPPKKWTVAEVPEGADPLDYVNMEKLKVRGQRKRGDAGERECDGAAAHSRAAPL